MPRGGKRKGSGRKSTWKSGCKFEDTKLIRVPKAIAPQILEIAHKLDSGESLDLVTKQLSLLEEVGSEISKDTRLTGVALGQRLGVASAALTPPLKKGEEAFKKYTKERDPKGIAWIKDGRKYRPATD